MHLSVIEKRSLIIPPLAKLVDLETIRRLAESLDRDRIERYLGIEVRKIRKINNVKIYSLPIKGRGLTPNLIYVAFRWCPVYAYFNLCFRSLLATEGILQILLRGVLAHDAYSRALKERQKTWIILREVAVDGEIGGTYMNGRIDLIVQVPDKLKLGKRHVVGIGGRLYIIEVKTSTSSRALQAAAAQAAVYRRLLDLDNARLCIVGNSESKIVGTDMKIIEEMIRLIAKSREPPYQHASTWFCKYCPYRLLKICEKENTAAETGREREKTHTATRGRRKRRPTLPARARKS